MPQAALLDAQPLDDAVDILDTIEVSMPQAALLDAQLAFALVIGAALVVSMPQAALLDAQLIEAEAEKPFFGFNAASGIA